MLSHQFETSNPAGQRTKTHQQLCILNVVLEWLSQCPDLHLIEILWHDLKQPADVTEPSNVAESKQGKSFMTNTERHKYNYQVVNKKEVDHNQSLRLFAVILVFNYVLSLFFLVLEATPDLPLCLAVAPSWRVSSAELLLPTT
ncbi:hypothetical protein ILYODFUR_037591 [Ilyodon furcidens]|uniref:Uncharacterized protein n=1 Tax=Ilyodon furcidens TaxID=33524 RepID=A0ABV0T6S5_9TELE